MKKIKVYGARTNPVGRMAKQEAQVKKPARRDPEGGKVSATGWPPQRVLGRRRP